MCGIFGYFDIRGNHLDPDKVARMGLAIRHRGPDDQGIHFGNALAIGNQRLSIIDIEGGHQPFMSDDGSIVVVQNGEIFNHVELAAELGKSGHPCRSHSDTEVLLRLYEREGISFVSRLNGMFAIAIYDRREDALFLIRDRIGVKPLYVHDDGQRICFGSEIKAILEAGIPRSMDCEAIHHYLTFNYVPQPFTAFEGVRHVKPGHWLRVDRQGSRKEVRWWSLADAQPVEKPEAQWVSEFDEILDDAVRLRLRADVPFGAFLSGGVDSSTIVGLMARHMQRPVKTFSIGFDDPRYDETPFALEAAERFGTEHVMERVAPNMLDLWPMAIRHCDQPHGDVSFLPTYRVSALAAQHVKMVLTGDGGDELFAGYDKYRDFFSSELASGSDTAFRQAYFQNISLFSDRAKETLYTASFARRIGGSSYGVVLPLYEEVRHWDRINQALYIDMQLLLSGNNLVKPDRMGMAVSLEARTPFLDYRMMEFAFSMPGNLKLRDGITKFLFKKAATPLIGKNLAYRKKQMFTVPVGDWFRTELAGYCRSMLLHPSSRVLEIVSRNETARMLDEHRAGIANHTREIRALLALEIWLQNSSLER